MVKVGQGRLRDKKEEVLSLWEKRSLVEIPSACLSGSLVLRNSLPVYLEHLSEALSSNRKMDLKSVEAHDDESVRIGKLHGADRAGNTTYLLSEIIAEYHILREVIFQVLETDGPLSVIHRDIVLDSIEQAVNDAAVKFSEVHFDIQNKFIDTLTHDLKSPIAAAMLNAQMILKAGVSEDQQRFTKRIVNSLNRVTNMIHDLLDAGRVRAGEIISLEYNDCDLNLVAKEVVSEMTEIHGDRFTLQSDEAVVGNWGCDGLRRALENLIGNAVKYGSEKTPIEIALKHGPESVELSVHNAGEPIVENEIPSLFESYRRSKDAKTNAKTGWGLGLTVVKGVVDAHHGSISVKSASGLGTTFTLKIPFTGQNTGIPPAP